MWGKVMWFIELNFLLIKAEKKSHKKRYKLSGCDLNAISFEADSHIANIKILSKNKKDSKEDR